MALMPLASDSELARLKTACSNWSVRELCLPIGLSSEEMSKVDDIVCATADQTR